MYSEDFERKGSDRGDDVYSKPVRAGKRTYFFDVKSTRGNNDFYLTITESKRRQDQGGNLTYDKHKIFLYKEDFEKFVEGLNETIAYIREKLDDLGIPEQSPVEPKNETTGFTDVNFDEL